MIKDFRLPNKLEILHMGGFPLIHPPHSTTPIESYRPLVFDTYPSEIACWIEIRPSNTIKLEGYWSRILDYQTNSEFCTWVGSTTHPSLTLYYPIECYRPQLFDTYPSEIDCLIEIKHSNTIKLESHQLRISDYQTNLKFCT